MNIKTTSFKNSVIPILLFLFLFASFKVKGGAVVSAQNFTPFYNAEQGGKDSCFDSCSDRVSQGGENELSQKSKNIKPLLLCKKYDDKSGGVLRSQSSNFYSSVNYFDEVIINYNVIIVKKIKLFLFYSSPKLPSALS